MDCVMKPSSELLLQVRIGFLQQGVSFAKWCEESGISRQWATSALLGLRDGPAARRLREKIIAASKCLAAA